MIKQLLLIANVIFTSSIGWSQDYYITDNNDTVVCSIDRIKTDGFTFTTDISDSIQYISFDDMSTYHQSYTKFVYGVSAGLCSGPTTICDYPNGQYYHFYKNGGYLDCALKYALGNVPSIGIKYDLRFTKNNPNNVQYLDSQGKIVVEDNIINKNQTHYIGATFASRCPLGKRRINIEFGYGYIYYNENSKFIDVVEVSGHGFGSNINVQYDIKVKDLFTIGCFVGVIQGKIKKINYKYGDSVEFINLNSKNSSRGLMSYQVGIAIKNIY